MGLRRHLDTLAAQARARLVRRGRTPGVRTGKTVAAAVIAFSIADALHTSDQPILAPLTALLVVQLSMQATFAHGWERVLSVTAGVSVAAVFANVVGLTWWSLGAVVAVSLVMGRLLRLGPHLPEVAISAMLVLAVGGGEVAATQRVVETLIGAAVGILINLIIAPPLYLQPAGDAISELAEKMAAHADGLAAALRDTWTRDAADRFLDQARALGAEVARAEAGLARVEEGARLNRRAREIGLAQPRLRSSLTALEHAQISLRNLSRALLDRTYYVDAEQADDAYPPAARAALAEVVDAIAAAVRAVAPITAGDPAGQPEVTADVEHLLTEVERRTETLRRLLRIDPDIDPAAWQQHGALLAAIDRLRIEIDAAVRPTTDVWRPTPIAARSRDALRRTLPHRRTLPTR